MLCANYVLFRSRMMLFLFFGIAETRCFENRSGIATQTARVGTRNDTASPLGISDHAAGPYQPLGFGMR